MKKAGNNSTPPKMLGVLGFGTYCKPADHHHAEGDISRVDCPTVKSFKTELEEMEKTYGPAPAMAVAYDEMVNEQNIMMKGQKLIEIALVP